MTGQEQPEREIIVTAEGLCKSFYRNGEKFAVLEQVSLSLSKGEFFVLLGRSGCGKTTLLRCMGGFLKPDSGQVFLQGKQVTKPNAEQMMVFQNFDQLFPWMTLKKNLTYAMKKVFPAMPKKEREERALDYLAAAGLQGFENQYPAALSGGMKQRGALARALAVQSKVLLMDEPFSSLDYLSRQSARETVKHLAEESGCTVFLVTHDIEEAILLGSRIGIFDSAKHTVSRFYSSAEYADKQLLLEEIRQELSKTGAED